MADVPREVELAWAAGFWDGEGSTVGRDGEIRMMLKQATDDLQLVPEVLVRFHEAVRSGRVGGPYVDRPTRLGFSLRRRATYMWYAANAEARAAFAALELFLGEVKRAQFARAVVTATRLDQDGPGLWDLRPTDG